MPSRPLLVALFSSLAVFGLIGWLVLGGGDAEQPSNGDGGQPSRTPIVTSDGDRAPEQPAAGASAASITGRVLDARGDPVAGVTITCVRLSAAERTAAAPPRVVTGADGAFAIPELTPAEYRLETRDAPGYAPLRQNVRAPSANVTLVLHAERILALQGSVTDSGGQPLGDVEVSTGLGEPVRTGADGTYRLTVKVTRAPGTALALAAKKPGYADQQKTVPFAGSPDASELNVSFQLDRVEDVGSLRGVLADTEGNAVVGETLHLQSASRSLRYQARSGGGGAFVFENVRAAGDYQLRVLPTRGYRDQTIEPLEIRPGPNELDVTLEPFEVGVLNGIVVDASGAPLADFQLALRSEAARAYALSVTSGPDGRFRAEGVPAGPLLLETRALPKVTVRGLTLGPNQELTSEIPIGIGDRTVSGTVTLPDGSPVVGARVVVAWTRRMRPINSTAYSHTLTDASGGFSISGFGQGSCSVSVTATGLEALRESLELSAEEDPAPLRLEMR